MVKISVKRNVDANKHHTIKAKSIKSLSSDIMRIDKRVKFLLESVSPSLVVAFLLTFLYFLPFNDVLVGIRLLLGITALFVIPGYCVAKIIFSTSCLVEIFGLSLLFGVAIQMINVLLLYSVVSTFFCEQINFGLMLIFLTVIFTLVCCVAQIIKVRGTDTCALFHARRYFSKRVKILSIETLLFPIFIIAVTLRIYFQSFSLGPATDGANYLEYARSLVQNGIFTSKAIYANSPLELVFSKGLNPHIGTCFNLSLFFEIGGISYFVGKMMVVFFGALLIFPVYGIAKELLNVKAGLIASVITAVHPFLLEYSSMLYGPEIIGAVFLTSSFYLLTLSIQKSQPWQVVLAGLFAFLTLITWDPNIYVYLAIIPLSTLLLKKKIGFKNILLAYSIVGFWGFTYRFSAHIPLGLVFHIGTPVMLVLVALIKRREGWVRSLCLFLLTMNILLEFYWIRSFYFSEVYITPVSEIPAGTLLTGTVSHLVQITSIGHLFNRLNSFLRPAYLDNLSPILIILGFMSLMFLKSWRKSSLLLLFPLFQLVFYALFLSEDMLRGLVGWENRLLLASTPFFAILAAIFIDELTVNLNLQNPKIIMRLLKPYFSINISPILTAIMISSIFLTQFYPQYLTVIDHIESANIKTRYHLDAAINWVNENTKPDDIIGTRKPYEWAWYTDRKCVIFSQDIDLNGLFQIIKKYRVNYVIVDDIFYNYYCNLKSLYTNPEIPPFGFQLVFRSDDIDGKRVLIYNTTRLIYTDFLFKTVPIDDLDNLTGWVRMYGNLSLDILDKKEGNASIKLEGLLSPSRPDLFVAKVYRDIIVPDCSGAVSFSLWIKSDTMLDKIFFQIFDANYNWRMYSIPYTHVGQWQNVTIPIDSFTSQSSTPPDLTRLQRVVFWVPETPKPFTLWIDQLSVTLVMERTSE